jgi:two-component system phosphate regulon sensor histidine kinase PhoR
MYAALPVFASGNTTNANANTVGTVAGVFRLSVEDASRPPATFPFLICVFVLTLAALAAITIFSHSFAVPLRRLADIAETMADKRPHQHISSIVDASGEAEELFVLETALRRMEEKLSRGAEQTEKEGRQLLAILNGMSEAVLAMDNKLILYLANPRARSLFGLADITGSSLLEATRSTELDRAVRKVLAEGRSLEMELKIKTGNGEIRTEQWFQVFATPLFGLPDPYSATRPGLPMFAPTGVVMVLENITRLVKLEQMRKDFVANVSHERRPPIQLIKGFSETLLDIPPENEEQSRRCVQIIHKNVLIMENLTNDLLVLANLEDNAESSPLEEQRIPPLFDEAVSLVEPQVKSKKTEIVVDCPADCVATVHGPFIIQALVNLFDNGIKY